MPEPFRGSAPLTVERYDRLVPGRLTQRLECHPHTVEVTGSNPVPPIDSQRIEGPGIPDRTSPGEGANSRPHPGHSPSPSPPTYLRLCPRTSSLTVARTAASSG